jgi:cytochrome c-type biogenesis protein
MMVELGGLGLGYAAGALSTLSPCVLPLLPIILFGAIEQHAWGPVALAAGLSASFAGVGIFLVSLGFSLGIDPTAFRLGAAALILIIGIVLLVPTLQRRLALLAAPVAVGGQALADQFRPSGIGGQFALGILLGAIWSPCSGPTLGAAIGLAAQSETAGRAAAIMAMFSLGAVTPILALAYGSRQAVVARRDFWARTSRIAKPLVGATLVSIGAFVLTGFDKVVEASLTRAMPDWLVTVTTRL